MSKWQWFPLLLLFVSHTLGNPEWNHSLGKLV